MFSQRTAWNREPNPLSTRLAELREAGKEVLDLTRSNPTECGFTYPSEFYAGLTDERSSRYAPEPLGLPIAREAVSGFYRARGRKSSPRQIWISAGTSELYAHVLWTLCDPADAVLVPHPGYPLFDYLGDLAGVRRIPYRLHYDGAWGIDMESVREGLEAGAKAMVLVSPGNPTGNFVKADEFAAILNLCSGHGASIVVDEVFSDYGLADKSDRAGMPDTPSCLTFTLSGISKVAALPQMKLSWGVVQGPAKQVEDAIGRLAIVSDTFLTASTPVQLALPRILDAARPMQDRIRGRLMENLHAIRDLSAGSPLSLLHAEGGWTALLRLPALHGVDDQDWAMRLLEKHRTYAQPGFLFDLPSNPPHLAISLLTETALLRTGMQQLLALAGDLAV